MNNNSKNYTIKLRDPIFILSTCAILTVVSVSVWAITAYHYDWGCDEIYTGTTINNQHNLEKWRVDPIILEILENEQKFLALLYQQQMIEQKKKKVQT